MNKRDLLDPNIVKTVKNYFFTGLDLVDEGANFKGFNFFKRLEQGGENKMAEIVQAPKVSAKDTKEIMTQLDPKEGIKGDALKDQQAEMDAMEEELKQAEAENATLMTQTFEEAKAGDEPAVQLIDPNTMKPVEVQAQAGRVFSEQELVQAETNKYELENLKLRLEKAKADNAILRGQIPTALGMDRKPVVRLQSIEDEKTEEPVEKKASEYHSMTEVQDDFANALRNDPNAGIISGS